MITNDIVGRYVTLKSATVDDAEFALAMRQLPKALKFMPPLNITLEQQKSWIEKQRTVEDSYFFIAWNNNERVGVTSVYDIQEKIAEVGRIVMQGNMFESIESMLLLRQFCFDVLKLEKIIHHVLSDNVSMMRGAVLFGSKFEKMEKNEVNGIEYKRFVTDVKDFKKAEPEIKKILYDRK